MSRSREEGAMGAAARGNVSNAGDGRPALTTNDALLYLREVKQRFQQRKEVYDTFLDIMKDFKSQSIDIATVISKVKTLLRGHEDLILGFNTFLPRGSEITMEDLHREEVPPPPPQIRPAVELDQAIAYINRIKTRFADDSRVYKNFLEILCCFRQGRMDISDVYRDVADLFQHHEDLLEEFSYFLPERPDEGGAGTYGGDMYPLGRPLPPMTSNAHDAYNDAGRRRMESSRRFRDFDWDLGVFEEIKSRLNNREAYNDLLKCVNLFAHDVISKTELIGLGGDVLGRFPDIMARFREFVASIPGDDDSLADGRGRETGRAGYGHYQRNRAMLQQRNKYLTRPVSELDTSDLERPTTSYILLPADYPSMSCSGKTALGREVLQDVVASVTTGTEDGSFKHMRKNQYEEALFRAEDERYDVELIIDRTRSTIKALIPIQECIESLSPDAKAAYTLPQNTLRAFHVRTIEKIYGEKGNSVCELLKNHPVVSVPVVLCRLQQKLEEWTGVLKTMNSHWQAVADLNYYKSLDHRSFYFKQQDKKSLAPKTLLQELKDEAEAARTNQRMFSYSSGIPVQSLFVPHLQFTFDEEEVHEDMYNIVRFAASKMLAPDAWRHGMEIWTKFIEPFFHLTPHSLEVDLMEVNSPEMEEVEQKETTDEPEEDIVRRTIEEPAEGTMIHPVSEIEPKEEQASDGEFKTNLTEVEETKLEPTDEDLEDSQEEQVVKTEEEPESSVQEEQDPSTIHAANKPIATVLHNSEEGLPKAADVFFCNETFYLFLRYHQILFNRIKLARKCCREHGPGSSEEPTEALMTLDQETTEKRHSQFMSLVYTLIDGSIDIAQFEDQCRSLLSTNSYVLFTLDKLIRFVVKQLHALVQDDPSKHVWELYKYEASRTVACDEGVYYANAKTVVREDYVVRVCSHPSGLLTMTHLDNSFVYDLPNGNPKSNHGEYFNSFMDASERKAPESAGVFLNRNKHTVQMQSYDPTAPNEERRMEDALAMGLYDNGLEMKVSGEDYKIKFVEGTADLWLSAGNMAAANDKQKRKQLTRRWIAGQLLPGTVHESVEYFMRSMQRRI